MDNLGTVRDLARQDGTIAAHYKYDAYGNVTGGDTSLTRYLFTSRELDADTGLQYNRARWYDPQVGRWISEDPLGFVAGDANVARYVGNGVTAATDPSGNDKWFHWTRPIQSYVYIRTQNGHVYRPGDAQGLIQTFRDIENNGDVIRTLIIKGHGSPETIEVGRAGVLTVSQGGDIIVGDVNNNQDVTDTLNDITDQNTEICLRGCRTSDLASDLNDALGGAPSVSGSPVPTLGIPFTTWMVGPWYTY